MIDTDLQQQEVTIGAVGLRGILTVPEGARGLVIFAHGSGSGSGSGRLSPRNVFVAHGLQRAGLATLLLNLLTPAEEQDRSNVFDILLLAARLDLASDWARGRTRTAALPFGYFGASTGGSAALVAAAHKGNAIRAVVARGGRPDLAGSALPQVTAPTLLIVGSLDKPVIDLNLKALEHLHCEKHIAIVPGASQLFEEPGTRDQVVQLAASWFLRHLPARHEEQRNEH